MAEKKSNNSNKKGIIFIIIAIVVIIAISLTGYLLSNSNDQDGPKTLGKNGDKTITIEVIVSKDDIRTFIINTSAETLLEALQEQDLIGGEQQDYGYFITEIDDVVVDPDLNQWWCIYVDDHMIDTLIDKTPIKDGDKFNLELIDANITSSTPSM